MIVHKQDLNEDSGGTVTLYREIPDVGGTVTLYQEIPSFSECHKDNAEARLNNCVANPAYQMVIIYKR